jgi:hypothetical protein
MTAEATTKTKEDRVSRLSGAVARIRARTGRIDAPKLLMLGGAILMPLGLGLIGMAWYGAAHTPFLFEQVPYLISGGLLGLAVSTVGGFLYFAYWLTLLIRDNRAQSRRVADALEGIRSHLAKEGIEGAAEASPNGEYVTTDKGTMFHRPDCTVVADRTDLRRVSADTNLRPCKICDPLGAK